MWQIVQFFNETKANSAKKKLWSLDHYLAIGHSETRHFPQKYKLSVFSSLNFVIHENIQHWVHIKMDSKFELQASKLFVRSKFGQQICTMRIPYYHC